MNDELQAEDLDFCEVPRWQKIKASLNNLSFAAFVEAAKQDAKSIVIDVRTAGEYEVSKIEGAINLDYLSKNLADNIEALNPDMHYYIYCRTGRRSLRVCVIMRNLGFKTVYNLEGGIVAE